MSEFWDTGLPPDVAFKAEIARLRLKPDDILLVGLDFGHLPRTRANEYTESFVANIREHIHDNDIIVVPKGTEITLLDTTGDHDEKERP